MSKQPASSDTTTAAVDVALVCVDCSDPFVWTAGEQLFFADRELQPPKRCRSCLLEKRRRQTREAF